MMRKTMHGSYRKVKAKKIAEAVQHKSNEFWRHICFWEFAFAQILEKNTTFHLRLHWEASH